MKFRSFLLLSALNFVSVHTQSPPAECLKPLAFGKVCTTAEPSIRYHFDNSTSLCMAFKYNGCKGNKNNFDSESFCNSLCKPTDIVGCPVNSKPVKKADGSTNCKQDEDCTSKGYCSKRLSGGGLCCSKAIREKLDSDYAPKCVTGRVVVTVDNNQVLIGKNCSSNFCPDGSNCRKGNYFSTCCKKA